MIRMTRYFKTNSKGDIALDIFKVIFLTMVLIVTVYPFLNILAISLNDATDSMRGGIYLWPRRLSFASYISIFNNREFMNSIRVTVARTGIGTPVALFVQSSLAYALSRKELMGNKKFTLFFLFTMYFGGGMIPSYMVIKGLGLLNNFWVFILPGALSVYNMILIRSYISSLPEDLIESARLDGANDLQIYYKIILPLIKPILLTVGLFIAVGQWNSWFDAYIYTSSQNLKPMQAILVEILNQFKSNGSFAEQMSQTQNGNAVTPDSLRMAATLVTTIPIIMVYPFIQKYFVKGMMIGAVKD